MKKYKPVMSFDENAAEDYDNVAQRGDEMATVAFLEQLARGGPALELAIGTGRIALPLSARGIRVDGIDFSSAMVAKLRAKSGGAENCSHPPVATAYPSMDAEQAPYLDTMQLAGTVKCRLIYCLRMICL